jgi:redox-sensitive bicupin YhaK (pirin superfamily)
LNFGLRRSRNAAGLRSSTGAFSDRFNADVSLIDGARFHVSAEHIERAVCVVGGRVEVESHTGTFAKDQSIVFKPGAEIVLKASGTARLIILGGEPLGEERHIYWKMRSETGTMPADPGDRYPTCWHALF